MESENLREAQPQARADGAPEGADIMEVALCYESVLPQRGGCETYISDLARRLSRDGHRIHLFARQWDNEALPPGTHTHRVDPAKGPRFLRPWRFARACERALRSVPHDVSIGFDKTWGQDILYPQGGLHLATVHHNTFKYKNRLFGRISGLTKWLDPATISFAKLERKQYLTTPRPQIVVNSRMVQRHFQHYYGITEDQVTVLPSAIDPGRFVAEDRLKLRSEERDTWSITPDEPVALFVGMNYRLKGLAPLIEAVTNVPESTRLTVAVVGNADTAKYKQLAKARGVEHRFRFLGFRKDPKAAYFASDFLVHPTFYDPCSLVVLEALACGLPIVTTSYNGASELLTPANGLVVKDPHDAKALAMALVDIADGTKRSERASAARKAAAKWTFEHHYQGLLKVMANVKRLKQAA